MVPIAFPARGVGHALYDANNRPITIVGDSCWGIVNELTFADVQLYLADRRARGFNFLVTQASNPDLNGDNLESVAPAARGASMALPYTKNILGTPWTGVLANHDAAFDFPNDTYWNWVETVFTEMRNYGFLAKVSPLYWGQTGGWWANLQQAYNTLLIHYNHGLYLGARFKNHPNVIIDMGVDRFPVSGSADSAKFDALIQGMVDAGCTNLITAHYERSSDSLDYADYASRVTLNSSYPGTGAGNPYTAVYARLRAAWAKTPVLPTYNVEAIYDGDPAGGGAPTRTQLRSFAGWSFTSGGGYVYGQRRVEAFEMSGGVSIWKNYLDVDSTRDVQRIGEFLNALPFPQPLLVPDGLGGIGTLVTAGLGGSQGLGTPGDPDNTSGLDRVTAAADPGRTCMIAYYPPNHTGSATFDMTKMGSGTVRVRWFDPTSGAYVQAGYFTNTGTQAFSTPGNNSAGAADWFLVFDLQNFVAPRSPSPVIGAGVRASSKVI
jgi:hypothetical protein